MLLIIHIWLERVKASEHWTTHTVDEPCEQGQGFF